MKRQGVYALLSLDRVNPNHRRLAGKLDGRDDRVQLGHIEISFELLARLPIFDQQQRLASVDIRVETRVQAARSNPGWSEHRAEGAQQCCSPFIGGYNLHREDDHDS